jgi:hypothetical protein
LKNESLLRKERTNKNKLIYNIYHTNLEIEELRINRNLNLTIFINNLVT